MYLHLNIHPRGRIVAARNRKSGYINKHIAHACSTLVVQSSSQLLTISLCWVDENFCWFWTVRTWLLSIATVFTPTVPLDSWDISDPISGFTLRLTVAAFLSRRFLYKKLLVTIDSYFATHSYSSILHTPFQTSSFGARQILESRPSLCQFPGLSSSEISILSLLFGYVPSEPSLTSSVLGLILQFWYANQVWPYSPSVSYVWRDFPVRLPDLCWNIRHRLFELASRTRSILDSFWTLFVRIYKGSVWCNSDIDKFRSQSWIVGFSFEALA